MGNTQQLQVGGCRHAGPLPLLALLKVKAHAHFKGEDHPPCVACTVNQKLLPTAANAASEAVGSLLTTFRALLSNQKIMEPFLEHLQCVPVRADCREDGCLWWSLGYTERERGMEGLTWGSFVC